MSNDVGLGSPFNIAEGAALMELFSRLAGMEPGRLTYMIGDAHIYENQLSYLAEQTSKRPLPLPRLKINDRIPSYKTICEYRDPETALGELVTWLGIVEPSDFELVGYEHHTLTTPVPAMAV